MWAESILYLALKRYRKITSGCSHVHSVMSTSGSAEFTRRANANKGAKDNPWQPDRCPREDQFLQAMPAINTVKQQPSDWVTSRMLQVEPHL